MINAGFRIAPDLVTPFLVLAGLVVAVVFMLLIIGVIVFFRPRE